jgi:Abortive infection C-terminus
MAEAFAVPFAMHGARAAMALGLSHIEEQVKAIERAVVENPGLAFDLAKSLIESACRTILTERGAAFDPGDDLPRLFRTATQQLPFLPTAASGEAEARESLVRTLSGLNTAVQGVCELRNACGFASHGSDSLRPAMESVQALLAASAADAIIGFLHRVHRQNRVPPPSAVADYDKNPKFNDSVDEAHGVIRIFEVEFKPSEVLFRMEPQSYRIYLAEFEPEPVAEENAPVEAPNAEAAS